MAIFLISSVSKLRKLAIKVNRHSCTYIRELLSLPKAVIPVSFQITTDHFINCQPKTFNFGSGIIVIVINNEDILLVPSSAHVFDLLDYEGYILDTEIYLPNTNVNANSFKESLDRLVWKFASLILN